MFNPGNYDLLSAAFAAGILALAFVVVLYESADAFTKRLTAWVFDRKQARAEAYIHGEGI